MGGFLVVVVVAVVLAAFLVPWLWGQRRRGDLATVAARHGLEYSAFDPFGCARVAFPLFGKGDGNKAENVVWRDRSNGLPIRAFDFSYYLEGRNNTGGTVRTYKHFSCAMAQIDGAWPEVSITREGILQKALGLVGLGDIELESEEFNRRFCLRSPDKRFAVALVDAGMIDFLLSTEARFGFFVKGRWVLLACDPVSPDLVPGLMAMTETFVEHIPRVVYELWPSPFRDAAGNPLPPGDEAYGLALAACEEVERNPWDLRRRQPYDALERDEGPEYDLDGDVVEPQDEDPWGKRPKPLPE